MQAIIQENRHLVGYNGYTNDCLITVDEVRNAVHKLKACKRDGNFELSSDHFLNAGDDLFRHVALLLSAMVVPSDSLFFLGAVYKYTYSLTHMVTLLNRLMSAL